MTNDASGSRRTHLFGAIKLEPKVLLGVLALGLVLVLVKIAADVAEQETGAFDRAILLALRSLDGYRFGPWLRTAFTDITALGGTTIVTLLTIVAASYLVVAGRTITALVLAVAVSTGAIAEGALKLLFDRARPDIVPHLVAVTSPSFPSGHAMLSAITYLSIAALLAAAQEQRRMRVFVLAAGVCLVVLIGMSRVYLGVHWPTDVLAGWVAGSLWALLFWAINLRFGQRRAEDAGARARPAGQGEGRTAARAASSPLA